MFRPMLFDGGAGSAGVIEYPKVEIPASFSLGNPGKDVPAALETIRAAMVEGKAIVAAVVTAAEEVADCLLLLSVFLDHRLSHLLERRLGHDPRQNLLVSFCQPFRCHLSGSFCWRSWR